MTPTRTALQVDVPEAAAVLRAVAGAGLVGATLLGPPHVSLAHPWVDGPGWADHVPALERALSGQAAFPVRFGGVGVFAARAGRAVVHLVPDAPAPLRALAAAVGLRLATPHLSLARVRAGDVQAVADLAAPLLPVDAVVRAVEVRVQYDGRHWRVERTFTLADGTPPR